MRMLDTRLLLTFLPSRGLPWQEATPAEPSESRIYDARHMELMGGRRAEPDMEPLFRARVRAGDEDSFRGRCHVVDCVTA
jgi:hypothetical protein